MKYFRKSYIYLLYYIIRNRYTKIYKKR